MPLLALPLPPHEANETTIQTASKYKYIEGALIYRFLALGSTVVWYNAIFVRQVVSNLTILLHSIAVRGSFRITEIFANYFQIE
jgi:hypothetical protein